MDNTLIIFASNHGTVDKCARELFRLIDGKVDICNLNERKIVPDLTKYDSVIVGGSIHSGKIQDEIAAFCEKHLDELSTKRLGLFINCSYTGKKAQKQLDEAFPEELKRSAVVRDYFGGEVNEMKLTLWERIVTTQMIEKEDLTVVLSKEKIRRFAESMYEENNPFGNKTP
ncbi:flavodoxin domain-containing protein [Proteiniphilum sp. UBA1028]|jgi:menaquinone-dependent protoporphyrinogen oxidase|uniref:flavodoxin domain-containing protein n=1 Tax=Proteiniphilum sp. UBA1028 TaxID=1947251 RepID=UPI0025D60BBA|nr:flavodoxin domain-containing protein [Proteiniphilum sp. UBA1028]